MTVELILRNLIGYGRNGEPRCIEVGREAVAYWQYQALVNSGSEVLRWSKACLEGKANIPTWSAEAQNEAV